MLQKSKKTEMIKELESAVKDSSSLVFVNFHGMEVSEETVLRRDLRKEGVHYKVSRKTLLARALQGKAEGEIPALAGEVSLLMAKIPLLPLVKYIISKNPQRILNILGGIFEGNLSTALS